MTERTRMAATMTAMAETMTMGNNKWNVESLHDPYVACRKTSRRVQQFKGRRIVNDDGDSARGDDIDNYDIDNNNGDNAMGKDLNDDGNGATGDNIDDD